MSKHTWVHDVLDEQKSLAVVCDEHEVVARTMDFDKALRIAQVHDRMFHKDPS